jgi:hypothetical protein
MNHVRGKRAIGLLAAFEPAAKIPLHNLRRPRAYDKKYLRSSEA